MKNEALLVAGIVFLLVALMHGLRVISRVPVTIGGRALSLGLSALGCLLAVALAAWMFVAMKG